MSKALVTSRPAVKTPLGSPERQALQANLNRRADISRELRRTWGLFKWWRLNRERQCLSDEFDTAFWGRR